MSLKVSTCLKFGSPNPIESLKTVKHQLCRRKTNIIFIVRSKIATRCYPVLFASYCLNVERWLELSLNDSNPLTRGRKIKVGTSQTWVILEREFKGLPVGLDRRPGAAREAQKY